MCTVQVGISTRSAHPKTVLFGMSIDSLMQAPSARIVSLKADVDKGHERVTGLKDKLTAMWEAIMNERFRDILPSIRLNVTQGIAYWTAALPSYVLHDKYLKYLAWSMSDRVRSLPCFYFRCLLDRFWF